MPVHAPWLVLFSPARAAAQLISAMWVKPWGKFPQELPDQRIDLLRVEPYVVGVPQHAAGHAFRPVAPQGVVAVGLHERLPRLAHRRVRISSRSASLDARQVRVSGSRASSSAIRIPRSSATQLITLLKT
jgi:hypothetical protein